MLDAVFAGSGASERETLAKLDIAMVQRCKLTGFFTLATLARVGQELGNNVQWDSLQGSNENITIAHDLVCSFPFHSLATKSTARHRAASRFVKPM